LLIMIHLDDFRKNTPLYDSDQKYLEKKFNTLKKN